METKTKKEAVIPTFDYWMLSEMNKALEEAYRQEMKDGKYGRVFKHLADTEGLVKAKEAQAQMNKNRFHPLGKIALSMERIQQIKDVYNKEFNK